MLASTAVKKAKHINNFSRMKHFIENQAQLDELSSLFLSLSKESAVVAVDTEFLREKTYLAKLCLLQLGIGTEQYLIDVLAIADLSAIRDLFADQSVLKIFHAARQDLEVIQQSMDVMPRPIFDTQLAGAFCGADLQLGYGGMVKEYLGIELAKSQSRTDWSKRPLTEEQLNYAAEDVAYLEQLYRLSVAKLEASDRGAWFEDELLAYYEVEQYTMPAELAYKRLGGHNLKLNQQYLLRDLATWREQIAQRKNIPRSWVLKDDKLYDIVHRKPRNQTQLMELHLFGKRNQGRYLADIENVIKRVEVENRPLWHRIEPLNKESKRHCSELMKQLSQLSEKHQIAQGLLATRKDVEALYRNRQGGRLLSGWRKKVVGEPLLTNLSVLEMI